MSRPLIKIHNVELDEVVEREMNDAEFAQYQLDEKYNAARKAEIEANIAARQAILDRLGLTEEEARLLLG